MLCIAKCGLVYLRAKFIDDHFAEVNRAPPPPLMPEVEALLAKLRQMEMNSKPQDCLHRFIDFPPEDKRQNQLVLYWRHFRKKLPVFDSLSRLKDLNAREDRMLHYG